VKRVLCVFLLCLFTSFPIFALLEDPYALRCGSVAFFPIPVCCTVDTATDEVIDCVPYFL